MYILHPMTFYLHVGTWPTITSTKTPLHVDYVPIQNIHLSSSSSKITNPWPIFTLQWRHNESDGVLNHRRRDGLLNRLLRQRSKKPSKHRVTGLCEGNSPVNGEFPAQMASNAEYISIWWRHHIRVGSWISFMYVYYTLHWIHLQLKSW